MVRNQTEKITALTQKVDDLVIRMDSLSADNQSLKARMSCIEDKFIQLQQSQAPSKNFSEDNFINEILDGQSRSNMFYYFYLPEVAAGTVMVEQ